MSLRLRRLVASAEENHDDRADLAEVDPVARPEVQPRLLDPTADALVIAEVAGLEAQHPSLDARPHRRVECRKPRAEGVDPFGREVLADGDSHDRFVSRSIGLSTRSRRGLSARGSTPPLTPAPKRIRSNTAGSRAWRRNGETWRVRSAVGSRPSSNPSAAPPRSTTPGCAATSSATAMTPTWGTPALAGASSQTSSARGATTRTRGEGTAAEMAGRGASARPADGECPLQEGDRPTRRAGQLRSGADGGGLPPPRHTATLYRQGAGIRPDRDRWSYS